MLCGWGTLAIELLSFGVSYKSDAAAVTWITASEIDNDYFIVEKSQDGKRFYTIAEVKGAGSSFVSLSYEFVDLNISGDQDSYYRIVDVDFEGIQTRSDVFVLKAEENDDSFKVYQRFDNNVIVYGPLREGSKLYLYDLVGKLKSTKLVTEYSVELNVNNDNFMRGIYVLIIRDNRGIMIYSDKVIL